MNSHWWVNALKGRVIKYDYYLIVRFLDKLGHTGTRMQAVNGFFLLSSFFSVRLVYGFYIVRI